MFNPISAYKKRLDIKRQVFDADKNTLNLQQLNRFVNGSSRKPRTAPTYLRTKTRDLLANTLVKDMDGGKYGGQLQQVAKDLLDWCQFPGGAKNKNVRGWLKQLAEAKPVESVKVGSVKVESVKVESVKVESAQIPTWTYAQMMKDFSGDVPSGVSSEDGARSQVSSQNEVKSPVSSEDEANGYAFSNKGNVFDEFEKGVTQIQFEGSAEIPTEEVSMSNEESAPLDIDIDIFAMDVKAYADALPELPELPETDFDEALKQWADKLDEAEHKNNPHGLFNEVDAEIVGRKRDQAVRESATRRRPAPSLRPLVSQAPRPNDGVVGTVNEKNPRPGPKAIPQGPQRKDFGRVRVVNSEFVIDSKQEPK